MEAIAVRAVINKAADVAGNLAVEAGTRLYWLREEVVWIEGEMKQIQAYLEDIDSKHLVRSQRTTALVQNIRDIAYEVEDILDTFLPQMASYYNRPGHGILRRYSRGVACIFCYCFRSHNFAMEISKIKRRIMDIDRPKTTYDIPADTESSVTSDPRRPQPYADEPDIIGFGKDIEDLKSRLLDEEIKLRFISIVGMPGLGKTTLANIVFKSTRHRFECSAIVCVSQQPNIKEIIRDIATQVGLKEEKCGEISLEAQLLEYLRGKRYVIVFDDIWQTRTWDDLKICIPHNSENGSRIILTSRNSGVGRSIGGEISLHELQPLDPKSSWQLFCKMVMYPIETIDDTSCLPVELEEIGRKIVDRCGGVPLAIVVTVGLLRERERLQDRWNEVLRSMVGHQDDAVMSTLALSYKDLPIELKPCFLYFGLFPEDYEVFVFQLINLWVAEKFIKIVGTLTLEEVGEANLNKLISRNIIQVASREGDGRIRSCRIHDLLHTFCISMAEESSFFDISGNLTPISAIRARRLTTHLSGSINQCLDWANYQTPKLRSFLSFSNNDFLSMKQLKVLCKNFKFLRVLHIRIETGDIRSRVSLPNEIGNLIHLTYLRITPRDYAKCVRFPKTMSKLKNLLTLDLRCCSGIINFQACFRNMKQLRHILLPKLPRVFPINTNILARIRGDIASRDFDDLYLSNLQTLKAYNDSVLKAEGFSKLTSLRLLGLDYCTEETLTQLSNKLAMLHELEELRLALNLQATESATDFDLSICQKLSMIRFGYKLVKLPNPNKFPPNLTKLTFRMTKLDESSMETLGKLPKLKLLILTRDSYKGTRMVCSADAFPQLELLHVSSLDELEEIIIEDGGMPRLHKFVMGRCPRLKMLPQKLQNIMSSPYEQPIIDEMSQMVVIKVTMDDTRSHAGAMKTIADFDGVATVALTGAEKDHIVITGEGIDTAELMRCLQKNTESAELVSVGQVPVRLRLR